ncbi:MAG: nicotinate-nucleotide adenylyltransferase [Candidatus Omnitrophica bacterium]|nr:nicotinate-nucleotide adenylyltransferase [Candidatus Omnitrophota bacterium]MBU4457552.1 nicotinate-nucleotide adenylyltransferase [Candidatus Omnitrophota bacterium]
MRIGILGGSFDPIHNGHLYLAKKALNKLSLDKIIFIPAYLSPLKHKSTGALHRYEMVKLAIQGSGRFKISDIEIKRKRTSYSIETLRRLRRSYGKDAQFFFITGSDSLKELKRWKGLKDILRLCRFVVVKRPGFSIKARSGRFITLYIDAKDISATDIRQRIKNNRSIAMLVPKRVRGYIQTKKLYL